MSKLSELPKLVNLMIFHPIPLMLSIIFLIFMYKFVFSNPYLHKKKLPPSPPWLPIIGHLHQLGDRPHLSLQSLSDKYGDYMMLYLGSKPTIIVSSAKAAREIMKTKDSILANRPMLRINKKLLYGCRDVAAAPYGEYWRQMKSLFVLQLLSNKRVKSFRSIREEEMASVVEMIIARKGSVVNLSNIFSIYTNDVVCRAALGRKFYGDEGGIDFEVLFKEFGDLMGTFDIGDFIPMLGWIDRVNGLDKSCKRVFKMFDGFLERVVVEHLDKSRGGDGVDDGKVKDFVDVLLDAQKDQKFGFSIDRDSIKALVLDIFSAGRDTTYTVLEWAMAELLRNPRIMQKLQEEIRNLTVDKTYVDEDDLEKMDYLKAVIKETLRLHPPIPLLVPREATHDLKLDGYDISAGTRVIINAWAIHRDPKSWINPDEFNPDRFIDSSVDFRGLDFELIPFGGGRRVCPGISFAIASNEIVLANLLRLFNWSLPDNAGSETVDMSVTTGFTIHRQVPLLLVPAPIQESISC